MADLTASMLGSSNSMTRAQAVKEADTRISQRDSYLANVLAAGTHIQAVVPRGAADSAEDIRAVISADDTNVNQVPSGAAYKTPRARGRGAGITPLGVIRSGVGLPNHVIHALHELLAPP